MAPRAPVPDADTLLALMQAGDLQALDGLARAYGPRLLAVARRRCRLAADAEDAVQQALLSARDSMQQIRGEGTALAWLSTLVMRHCLRLNRTSARAETPVGTPCACDDPERELEQRELAAQVSQALMTLSRTDRLLFLLSAEGFDGVELAARFELSHDAVRGRLKRARARLREALDDTRGAPGGTSQVNPESLEPAR